MCSGSTSDVAHPGGALLDRPVLTEADKIVARLNEPETAAAINSLLDRAELIATLVKGLEQFLQRTDVMLPGISAGLAELRAAGGNNWVVKDLAAAFKEGLPAIQQMLETDLIKPRTIDAANELVGAATSGMEQAKASKTEVHGLMGLHRAMKEPDVRHGVGVAIEIARALGRAERNGTAPAGNGAAARA